LRSHNASPYLEDAATTIMLGKLYAPLKAAGVSDGEAQAAAEEVGDVRERSDGLENAMHAMHADVKSELSGIRSEFKKGFAEVRSEVAYLRGRFDVLIWAVGINAAATIAIPGVLLRH
jgi:NAD(P)-dependent dehydrogenase (short-subunit alcohol dehydrogenase family)